MGEGFEAAFDNEGGAERTGWKSTYYDWKRAGEREAAGGFTAGRGSEAVRGVGSKWGQRDNAGGCVGIREPSVCCARFRGFDT